MAAIWHKFLFQVFYVINPRKDHGLEKWRLIPVNIAIPEPRQKVQENLVIGCIIHFINHQHQWLWGNLAPFMKAFKQTSQRRRHF